MPNPGGKASFEITAAAAVAILAAAGILSLIAQSWQELPSALRITILLVSTGAAYAGGNLLRNRGYPRVSKAMLILGTLSYTLNALLIAQAYMAAGAQWLWIVPAAGMLASAYLLMPDA